MYSVPFHWYMDGTGNIPLVYGRNGKCFIIVPLDYWNSSSGILKYWNLVPLEHWNLVLLEHWNLGSGSIGTLESGPTGSNVYYSTVLYGTIYYSPGIYTIVRTK